MASYLDFDEMNVMESNTTKRKAIPYDEFFDEMDLTMGQKEDRMELARILEKIFDYTFSLALSLSESKSNVKKLEELDEALEDYLREALENYGIDFSKDAYWGNYVTTRAFQIAQATINHGNDEYYTSNDRAMYISENEANVILNHYDMNEAIRKGCTLKTWITLRDERVRDTHADLDNKTIPIRDYFVVGDSLMLHPCDINGIDVGAEEVVNCRCSVVYR